MMLGVIKPLLLATRPKTLPAAIVPVILGALLVYKLYGDIDFGLASIVLISAVLIQVATNFFNDVIDAENGADDNNRLGPIRATSSGLLSSKIVYGAAISCILIVVFFGGYLVYLRGWSVLLIGIPSLYFSYGYTGGAFPLAYRGLGEVFVLLFFGWVAVMGTVFVLSASVPLASFILGAQVGCLSAVLVLVNNIRDRNEDRRVDKNTIVVRFGTRFSVFVLLILHIVPFSLGVYWAYVNSIAVALLPLLALPLGCVVCFKVLILLRNNGVGYNPLLGLSALQLVCFSVFWSFALIKF